MRDADPARPSEAPGDLREDAVVPQLVSASGFGRHWVGIIAVVMGAAVMIVGLVSVYVYTRGLPAPAAGGSAALPPALPPPVLPVPSLPTASPPAASDPVPAPDATADLAPFAEDATAPVPIEAGRPLWGPRDAPVTLTVFGDFECPYTVAFLRVVFAEKARRGDGLRLSFRHAPLGQHVHGEKAARSLAAIFSELGNGTFWSVVQEIVRRGEPISDGVVEAILETLGIELLEGDESSQTILEEDAKLAASLFVRATPVAFVNGTRLDGFRDQRTLAEAIAKERRLAGLVLASGVAPKALYAARTRRNLIDVGEDPPERSCVPLGASPVRGASDALVTIVEFTEHACDYCREGDALVSKLLAELSGELRSVWKTYVLRQHPRARYAANFALEARRSGGDDAFWKATGALFGATDALEDEAVFGRAAAATQLAPEPLRAAAESGGHDAAIDEDMRLADSLGVSAAPTYFVNGRRVAGVLPYAEFRRLIVEELTLARKVRRNGAGNVAELACGAAAPKR